MIDSNKIIEKRIVPIITDYMVDASATAYDHYLKIGKVEILPSVVGNGDFADYINAGVTCDVCIRVHYDVLLRTDNSNAFPSEDLKSDYYIPVTINNLFIIDGKVRAPLNYVASTGSCCWYGRNIFMINSNLSVDFEKKSVRYTPNPMEYWVHEYVPFDKLGTVPAKVLKLSEEEGKRIYLQTNLDSYPTKLDQSLIDKLSYPEGINRDNIIYKKIISVYDALIMHLTSSENHRKIISSTRNKFNRLHKYYESALNTSIRQFFKGQSDYLVGMQNESNTNPATYETLANKVILEKYSQGSTGVIPATDYNESLALLVDPSLTPDSGNVNRLNEMNKCVHYDGFDTYNDVLDINGKKTRLALLDYLCAPILTSDYYDYMANKLKLPSSGDFHYRHKGKINKAPVSKFKSLNIQYIDTEPDDRLGRSSRSIPNMNYSDSVRISMGARMSNQSIEVDSCELPMVTSGHSDYKDSSLFVRTKIAGEVISIDDFVTVKGEGNIEKYRIPQNQSGQYNINISFVPTVSVGDKVRPDDIIVRPLGINTDGKSMQGYNAFIAFASYKGYTYEDGVVISQSFANKMTHTYVIDVDAKVYDIDRVIGLMPPGELVKSRDVLLRMMRKKSASSQVKQITDIFFPDENQKLEFDANLLVPNNIYEGYVVDMTYCKGGGTNEEAGKLITEYQRSIPSKVTLPFEYHYTHLDKMNDEPDEAYAYYIRFRIVVRAPLVIGDKITNRVGSKGIVSLILPDSEMWRTEDGKVIDCILNPMAVMSRKNVTQTMEAGLTLLADYVYKKVRDNGKEKIGDTRRLLKQFKFDDYLNLSDDEIVNKIAKDKKLIYTVGCYGRITPAEIADMLDLANLSDGKLTLIKPDGKKLKQKVVCGYQYMMKLQFLVSYSNKVTSDSDILDQMVLGYGGEKMDGQSLEEMIFWSLQSHGATKVINEFRETSGRVSEYWLKAHILTAGLDITEKQLDVK